jgi:hypothetical protein
MTLREDHRYTEGVCEQGTEEGLSDRGFEKSA